MRQRLGIWSTRVGVVGAAALVVAFVLSAVNYANGVHCPGCDRMSLTDAQFDFWERYFVAKESTYGAATVLLLGAIPLASPRRWPFVLAFGLALLALAFTPR